MKQVLVEKVVVNMGVGSDADKMKRSALILEKITGQKPTKTQGRVRIPDWGVRPGIDLGLKVTLRGKKATEFLKLGLSAKENKLPARSFDTAGNFGFGIKEHIDLPGIKYDPKLGIVGFDVLVALKKKGYRVKYRKIGQSLVGHAQRVTTAEAIDFVKALGVDVA